MTGSYAPTPPAPPRAEFDDNDIKEQGDVTKDPNAGGGDGEEEAE